MNNECNLNASHARHIVRACSAVFNTKKKYQNNAGEKRKQFFRFCLGFHSFLIFLFSFLFLHTGDAHTKAKFLAFIARAHAHARARAHAQAGARSRSRARSVGTAGCLTGSHAGMR